MMHIYLILWPHFNLRYAPLHRTKVDAILKAESHDGYVARSAPAHERAIRTLMDWNVTVDEAMFLGGLDKGSFLREFEPDFFFDDQTHHCESAAGVAPTGHVVSGVANKAKK